MPSAIVVADHPANRSWLACTLENCGFSVDEEADAEAGVAAALQQSPDLVLLDLTMPWGLRGADACKQLRAGTRLDATAVIMLAAHGSWPDVQLAIAAGADDCVVKPFSPSDLSRRAQAVVSRRRAGRLSQFPDMSEELGWRSSSQCWVKSHRGLIEKDRVGGADQRQGQVDPAALAAWERLDPCAAFVVQIDERDHVRDRNGRRRLHPGRLRDVAR